MNVTEPIRRRARDAADRTAIVRRDGGTTSYRDLDRSIDAAAHRLLAEGIRPGDVVLLALEGHNRLLVLELALARIGAAGSAPTLNPTYAAACIAESWPSEGPTLHARMIRADQDWFRLDPRERVEPVAMHAGDDAVAIVIQSSGTTSAVKSIPLPHRQLQARLDTQAECLPMPAALRQICVRRPSSSYGFSVRMRVLQAGGTIVVASTADEAIAMTERHRVTRLVLPPYWLERLLAILPAGSRALASLEQVEIGGSFLPEGLYRQAVERICPAIYTNYGITEGGFIAGGAMAGLDRAAGEVGRRASSVEVETLDPDGRVLPPGEEGILRMRGPGCTHGYLDAPEASARTFRDGWIVTGDLGRVGPDGTVTLGGRETENIDIGGYKISPRAIEEALLSIDAIVDAAAFGAKGPSGITVLSAAIVARGPVDRDQVAAAMRFHSPNAAPSFLMQVASIPRNEGGKVLRRELAATAEAAGAVTTAAAVLGARR